MGLPDRPPSNTPWLGAKVYAGSTVVVESSYEQCKILGVPVKSLVPDPDAPSSPLVASGSSLAFQRPPEEGLQLDIVFESRPVTRTRFLPQGSKDLALLDTSPLHAVVFERCRPLSPAALLVGIEALPKAERRDAARLFGEWAAWRGASEVLPAASACWKGDCDALMKALTR